MSQDTPDLTPADGGTTPPPPTGSTALPSVTTSIPWRLSTRALGPSWSTTALR